MDGYKATATSEQGAKYGVLCVAYDHLEARIADLEQRLADDMVRGAEAYGEIEAECRMWKRRAEVAEQDLASMRDLTVYRLYRERDDLKVDREDLRAKLARAAQALEMALQWAEVRHLDNDSAMEEWYLAARAAVEGWPQPTPDTPEQGETCRWTQSLFGTWNASCGAVFRLGEDQPGTGWFCDCPYCGKPIEITGGEHDA
jgi:hypothetical protein